MDFKNKILSEMALSIVLVHHIFSDIWLLNIFALNLMVH